MRVGVLVETVKGRTFRFNGETLSVVTISGSKFSTADKSHGYDCPKIRDFSRSQSLAVRGPIRADLQTISERSR